MSFAERTSRARYRDLFKALHKAADIVATPRKRVITVLLGPSWRWTAQMEPRGDGDGFQGRWTGSSMVSAEHAIDVLRRNVLKEFRVWCKRTGQYSIKRHHAIFHALNSEVR